MKKLRQNDGFNCLHGGIRGWGKKTFQGPSEILRNDRKTLEFKYVSIDGDEGFPGTLECRVWYYTVVEASVSILEIEYEAEFTGTECGETIVALTNHRYVAKILGSDARLTNSYFNLNPASNTIAGTHVTMSADQHLQLDDSQIPTGKIQKHSSVPEIGKPIVLDRANPVIDDCFVMDSGEAFTPDTRNHPLRKMVELFHPHTQLHLEVCSTEPAFQLYTGDGIHVPSLVCTNGQIAPAKGPRSGIAIEPCRYVDAQRKEWREQCMIKPGQKWGSKIRYRAWKDEKPMNGQTGWSGG